jgi:hypothetical protein
MMDLKGVMLKIAAAFVLSIAGLQNHFVWPREISAIDDDILETQIPFSKLPPRACEREMENADGSTGARYIDLNGDGIKELIVDDGTGGSGGPGFHIYQRSRGKWKVIAQFQGGITLCAKENGFYQLEVRNRGGGGRTGRDLFQFLDGEYRAVRAEAYKDGILVRVLGREELKNLSRR